MTVIEVNRPPLPATILSVAEREARKAMSEFRLALVPIVLTQTPKRTSVMARGLRPRMSRTATGVALTVGASRGAKHDSKATIAQVVRYVSYGTGIYRIGGGPKRLITARNPLKRMVLPGGMRRWTVRGQHPNPFMTRIRTSAEPKAQQAMRRGGHNAAKALEGLIR